MSVQSSKPVSDAQIVRCLAIPLAGARLLLPYTTIAEVAAHEPPSPVPHAPRWLLGLMHWRGATVPLVSFERLLSGFSDPVGLPDRVVVFNTLNANPALPFVAVPVQGVPRLTLVRAGTIETLPNHADDKELVLRRVRSGEASFIIPDFDVLEAMLLRLGIYSQSGKPQ